MNIITIKIVCIIYIHIYKIKESDFHENRIDPASAVFMLKGLRPIHFV